MFSILNAQSFDESECNASKSKRDDSISVPKGKYVRLSKQIKPESIIGTTSRSKNGCLCCRKRKKKCDETYPSCKACKKRGDYCVWASKKSGSKLADTFVHKSFNKPRNDDVRDEPNVETSCSDDHKMMNICTPGYIQESRQLFDATVTSSSLQDLESPIFHPEYLSLRGASEKSADDKNEFFPPNSLNLSYAPSSIPFLYLDHQGLLFLNFFEHKVSKILSVGGESSNYFLMTFLSTAISEESILNAIVSWGGFFLHGSFDNSKAKWYMNKSQDLINKQFSNKRNLNKYDYFILLCFNLILIGINVCSGDTSRWNLLLKYCKQLIEDYGGILKFCNDFSYSNDAMFLMSNFQYHDIMSSAASSNGTLIPIQQYELAFDDTDFLFPTGYGIDPLQGCNQPMYLVLGEIMNAKAVLTRERKQMDSLLKIAILEKQSEGDRKDIEVLRLDNLKHVNNLISVLDNKIKDCKPKDFRSTENDEKEARLHLAVFKLYSCVCQLYVNLYLKCESPAAIEQNMLLFDSLEYIHELIDSKMVVVLCLPLIMVSLVCCTKYDRICMEAIFERVLKTCPLGNIRKAWHVVQESWDRNPSGILCVDWVDICDEFGWDLCVC